MLGVSPKMTTRPQPEHIGRIRVNEDEARLMMRMLVTERMRLLLDRREAKEDGLDIYFYQRALHHLRNIRAETELLASQKGWDIGQPLSSHEEGADPPVPSGSEGSVGGRSGADDGSRRGLRGSPTTS
jgi:hypothetical protein